MKGKLRVAVLFGGQSSEHEVSLASARSIMRAMDPEKYDVVPVGITRRGAWLASGDPMGALRTGAQDGASAPTALLAPNPAGEGSARLVEIAPSAGDELAVPLSSGEAGRVDVVFPVLHGPYGEDGTIQGFLETAGVPYVGSGVLGSSAGMDKDVMKRLFIAGGLPVVPYVCVSRRDWARDPGSVQRDAESRIPYPMFAKPSNMGSSVGISKIHGPSGFAAALDLAARYDRRIIIEQGVDAREVECAVLGNDDPQASVVGEIVPGNEFYDYNAKYVDDNSDLIIPARIPERAARQIRAYAVQAFKAIDAAGMSRVDFFVSRDFSQIWVNEINTIPGFTRISMYPKLWEASGISYPELIDRLIALALERHADRLKSKEALDDLGGELPV